MDDIPDSPRPVSPADALAPPPVPGAKLPRATWFALWYFGLYLAVSIGVGMGWPMPWVGDTMPRSLFVVRVVFCVICVVNIYVLGLMRQRDPVFFWLGLVVLAGTLWQRLVWLLSMWDLLLLYPDLLRHEMIPMCVITGMMFVNVLLILVYLLSKANWRYFWPGRN